VSVDFYAGGERRWATGASRVYGPIAAELVAMSPHPFAGRTVLDAGAGTGAATTALSCYGARIVATDLSVDMLGWNATSRPPCAAADIRALPLAAQSVDDAVAAFVLNHLTDPAAGFAELARVTRPGGALLATVYANTSRSANRDRIDEVARDAGWHVPDWYIELKATAVPLLGTAKAMAAAAGAAGLTDMVVDERSVDVGITEPEQLVDYRFGQAHFTAWLDGLNPDHARDARRRAADTIRPTMEPYRPGVVFLSARVPD
jgi:ubiquinone/menaquinone biosynthesis C-methylase UbiE